MHEGRGDSFHYKAYLENATMGQKNNTKRAPSRTNVEKPRLPCHFFLVSRNKIKILHYKAYFPLTAEHDPGRGVQGVFQHFVFRWREDPPRRTASLLDLRGIRYAPTRLSIVQQTQPSLSLSHLYVLLIFSCKGLIQGKLSLPREVWVRRSENIFHLRIPRFGIICGG